MNIYLSDDEAYLAYHNWSEDYYAAGWLCLPEDSLDLYKIMRIALNNLVATYARMDQEEI